jgi:hypothetical protein
MKLDPSKDTELHDKIHRETARIAWQELERHFAQGNVVYVSPELDLIEVAMHVTHDDKEAVQRWMAEGKLVKVSDAQAQTWALQNTELWTCVVSPFVLVQPPKLH